MNFYALFCMLMHFCLQNTHFYVECNLKFTIVGLLSAIKSLV